MCLGSILTCVSVRAHFGRLFPSFHFVGCRFSPWPSHWFRSLCLMGLVFLCYKMKRVLNIYSGNYMPVWMYLIVLSCWLKCSNAYIESADFLWLSCVVTPPAVSAALRIKYTYPLPLCRALWAEVSWPTLLISWHSLFPSPLCCNSTSWLSLLTVCSTFHLVAFSMASS